ncbi:MAG: hypothetical protein K6F32_07930 [Bacilli bacterium]|nr:hypothetical protein [Bacilli bacterium]
MLSKNAFMVVVALVGVAGTAAVAVSGQNVFSAPSLLLAATAKTKTFGPTTKVLPGDPLEYYESYVGAAKCDDGVTPHTDIGISASSYTTISFNGSDYFANTTGVTEQNMCYIFIGLNGFTRVSVSYTASDASAQFIYDLWDEYYDEIYLGETVNLVKDDDEPQEIELFTYDGTSGTAVELNLHIKYADVKIHSITASWTC